MSENGLRDWVHIFNESKNWGRSAEIKSNRSVSKARSDFNVIISLHSSYISENRHMNLSKSFNSKNNTESLSKKFTTTKTHTFLPAILNLNKTGAIWGWPSLQDASVTSISPTSTTTEQQISNLFVYNYLLLLMHSTNTNPWACTV